MRVAGRRLYWLQDGRVADRLSVSHTTLTVPTMPKHHPESPLARHTPLLLASGLFGVINAVSAPARGQSADFQGSAGSSGTVVTTSYEQGDAGAASAQVARYERRFRLHNTLEGAVGGFRVVDAGSAPAKTFRLQVAGEYFGQNEYLFDDDDETDLFRLGLSASWSVIDYLELYGAVFARSMSNDRQAVDPIQTIGDSVLGVKGYYPVLPWLSVGGDARAEFYSSVGDVGTEWSATSAGLRLNLTTDLQAAPVALPLIFRLNAGYFFDNTSKLINDVEDARYAALADPRPLGEETRHLVDRGERLGYGINRLDAVELALGAEAPIKVGRDTVLAPIVEWNWALPVNRQDYTCPFVASASDPGDAREGDDSCYNDEGIKASPMTVTAGLRVLPPVRGLALFAGVDVGVLGRQDFVRELSPVPTYNVFGGISFAYEPVRPMATKVDPCAHHVVVGKVLDKESRSPIEGARVDYLSHPDFSAQLSDADGAFRACALMTGERVEVKVSHPDYRSTTCASDSHQGTERNSQAGATNRPAAGDGSTPIVECLLEPMPLQGAIDGRVVDGDSNPIAGVDLMLRYQGPSSAAPSSTNAADGVDADSTGPSAAAVTPAPPAEARAQSDAQGSFVFDSVPPGVYRLVAQSDAYLSQVLEVGVRNQERTQAQLQLTKRPDQSDVALEGDQIRIKRRILFATGSATILPESFGLMSEIVDTILRHPELRLVEVQGHTDDRGSDKFNLELSQNRADSVRNWLVDHGIQSERLRAKGYGETQPLAPNITAANRARNRRVQFQVVEREEGAAKVSAQDAGEPEPASTTSAKSAESAASEAQPPSSP